MKLSISQLQIFLIHREQPEGDETRLKFLGLRCRVSVRSPRELERMESELEPNEDCRGVLELPHLPSLYEVF